MLPVEVVESFRAGDESAVRAVYDEFGRLVFAVANRILRNRALAEEASQQAFVQAWRASSSFDASRDLGPWLATIARRAAIDIHRREQRRAHGTIDEAAPTEPALISLPPNVDQAYAVWQVREAIDSLPPDDRLLVQLLHLEGLTHPEVADRLGIPLGTVKSRSFRVHKVLAARLGHLREGVET